MLETALEGAAFLLNAPDGPDEVWDRLPREIQEPIVRKRSASSSSTPTGSRGKRA